MSLHSQNVGLCTIRSLFPTGYSGPSTCNLPLHIFLIPCILVIPTSTWFTPSHLGSPNSLPQSFFRPPLPPCLLLPTLSHSSQVAPTPIGDPRPQQIPVQGLHCYRFISPDSGFMSPSSPAIPYLTGACVFPAQPPFLFSPSISGGLLCSDSAVPPLPVSSLRVRATVFPSYLYDSHHPSYFLAHSWDSGPLRGSLTPAQDLQLQSIGLHDGQSSCRQGITWTRFLRRMNTGLGAVPSTSRLRSCLPKSQKQLHFPQGPRIEFSTRDGGRI
jgi:hypothetical protein